MTTTARRFRSPGWPGAKAHRGAPRIGGPAALIGHLNLTHPNSVQVIGAYEAGTSPGSPTGCSAPPAALIVADGVAPPPELLEGAERTRTPLFTSPLPAARVIEKLANYLAKRSPTPPSATAC